jgi:hypothetical protein
MCADCKADLAKVQHDLELMTTERNQLTVMLGAAMNVMTPAQFAEMRRQVREHDADGDSAV